MGQTCCKSNTEKNKDLLFEEAAYPSTFRGVDKKRFHSCITNFKSQLFWQRQKKRDTRWKYDNNYVRLSPLFLRFIKSVLIFEHLKEVGLCFGGMRHGNDCQRFAKLIKSIPMAKKLHLILPSYQGFEEFAYFRVPGGSTGLTDEYFKPICEKMNNLVFLKDLTIDLLGSDLLPDKGIEYLTRGIKGLLELENVKLDIS